MSQHHLPGNPHFHQAGNLIGAAQANSHNEAKSSIALAKAVQAQTYEQRTANLIAERNALYLGLHPGEGLSEAAFAKYEALTKMIDAQFELELPEVSERPDQF